MKLTKEDLRKIWSEIKLNKAKLANCSYPHDFSIDITPEKSLNKTWQCTKCKGTTTSINREWYILGLNHSAGGVNV